jgi:ribonuclease Z
MKRLLLLSILVSMASTATAQTWEENLERGAATTDRNHLNVPFIEPENWRTPFASAGNWPIFENRGPIDRSPEASESKVLVIGTGDPLPNPFRYGPALAVIVNGYPYFIDCGEGWWRALTHSVLTQDGLDLNSVFALRNLEYMFLTHLHEDHTVGLPSFIFNPFKLYSGPNKKVFGPEGVDEMIAHINAAWSIDRREMAQGSNYRDPSGSTATGLPVWPFTTTDGRKIFEDDNVLVEAFPTNHGFLEHTYAYRFTAKSDGRVMVFGGDGTYSEGLVAAARGADILFIEGITRENIRYALWGGDTEEEKVRVIGDYHMFPDRLKRVQDESGVENIVLVHTQNYNSPDDFDRLSVLQEMIDEGVENVLLAQDGDLY